MHETETRVKLHGTQKRNKIEKEMLHMDIS